MRRERISPVSSNFTQRRFYHDSEIDGDSKCAASAHNRQLIKSKRLRAKYLLGHPTYLASKDKGESSMLEKRLNLKRYRVKCRKSCAHGEA